MHTPAVSVIMPIHNNATTLTSTLDSVVAQSMCDWEIMLVDDGSRDNGADLAVTHMQALGVGHKLQLIRLPQRRGVAIARNSGIYRARGRWIAFLDGDDLWLPNRLQAQLPGFDDNHVRLLCGGYDLINEAGCPLDRHYLPPPVSTYPDLLRANSVGCLTAIYDAHRSGKIYAPPIPRRQDYGIWLALLRRGGVALGVQQLLGRYRIRSGSISSAKWAASCWQWHLYHRYEKLSPLRATTCLFSNILARHGKYSPSTDSQTPSPLAGD